jgi:putative RNA 2'-phosphotransferase
MSLLLRHSQKEGLVMDKFGWVMIAQLIGVLDIKIEDLEQIVKEDNKQRFFNSSKTKIRASQGHSSDVMYNLSKLNHQVFCFMEQPLGFRVYI